MTSEAELSSLATALGDLTARLARLAEEAAKANDEELATELFAVERSLRGAERRLTRVVSGRARPRH